MRKKGLFSLFALIFAFALIAAACGSDDDGGDESSGDSTTTTAADDEGGDSAAQNTGDGTFTVGTLLPETGGVVPGVRRVGALGTRRSAREEHRPAHQHGEHDEDQLAHVTSLPFSGSWAPCPGSRCLGRHSSQS